MTENREYKSGVFSMLMEHKEYALQVYNALNGSHYDDAEQVEIVSLDKGISLSIRNDCAFIVDMSLNIYEHQSTYNPNMPLRALIYFVAYIKNMLKRRDVFSPRMIRIPTPHFAVFYNGAANRPDRETIKLSMAYEKPTDDPELELICTIYNINPDKDQRFLKNCPVLDEYMIFVGCVRRLETEGEDNPIERAIDYCIDNHILEEFLRENRAEVLNAMTIDMTFERREELIREEEQKEARDLIEKERKRANDAEKRAENAEKQLAELKEKMGIGK